MKLRRAARIARASAFVLVVLAGLSAALNVLAPLTVYFLISVLVLGNGIVEWRLARQLVVGGDVRVPGRLALNQLALSVEILGYAAWQLLTFSPAEIQAVLADPELRPYVDMLPPEQVRAIVEQLPPLVYGVLGGVGLLTAIGCWAMAWYYRTRRKFMLAAAPLPPA